VAVPSLFTRVWGALLGRGGRSLHMRAVGWATVALAVVSLAGSWLVVQAERGAPRANLTDYPKALWWSVETATTVGYGDLYPVTLWGRVIAGVVMFVGITTYGMVTAAIATWFVGREQRRRSSMEAVKERLGADARELHERFDRLERLLGGNHGEHGGHREH
jgi:voltage-gated potassium channel